MKHYAIVVIGYNRTAGMQRLLNSLAKCSYGGDKVDLIISIDNSGKKNVVDCAIQFLWSYGEKKVVTYPVRQGLRKHVLQCGDFVRDYDAIAVFEDDVVAAPGFYQYMKEAVDKYCEDDNIAGISLYSHLWNVNVNLPFEPAFTKYDAYFMQFAQSWGQIWMKRQWMQFAEWYKFHGGEFHAQDNIPDFVCGWPASSWLKYHIKYCIEANKYFVYPYKSLSTCYSDVGEHCIEKDTHLQIPVLTDVKEKYNFPDFGLSDAVVYDAFFERVPTGAETTSEMKSCCMDLYGSRTGYCGKRYIISSKKLPFRIKKSFALELRPHEMNVLLDVAGNDLFLYDSSVKIKGNKYKNSSDRFKYYFRLYGGTRDILKLTADKLAGRIRRKD